MKRVAVTVLCLAASLGCKKEEPTSAPKDEAVMKAPEQDAPPPEPEPEAAADAKLVVTDELMVRFMGYWEKSIAQSHQRMKEIAEVSKRADEKGGTMGAAHALQGANSIAERAEAQHDALLKEYDLTEEQVRELQGLATSLGASLYMQKQANSEQMIADMHKSLAEAKDAPPEQLAAAKKQVQDLETMLRAQATFQTQRKEYGDAAVDVALKHKDQLLELQERAYGTRK